MQIKKILFPTDFSEPAEKAFEYAVFMAKSHHAELELVHVVDQLQGLTQHEILAITPMEIAAKMAKRAREGLQALVDRVEDSVTATFSVREGKTWVVLRRGPRTLYVLDETKAVTRPSTRPTTTRSSTTAPTSRAVSTSVSRLP